MSARTAAPRLPPADVYAAACPSRDVLDHVTSRWGVLVLLALSEEMHRFSALRRKIGGGSEKMLSQTLTTLEADGFVQRTAYPEVPPRVEYRLTPLGREALAEQRLQWAAVTDAMQVVWSGQAVWSGLSTPQPRSPQRRGGVRLAWEG